MSPRISYLVIILVGAFMASCEDIFEPDIARKQVRLILPADNAVIDKATVTFSWETLEGARKYNIQIASPSFAEPTEKYIDTVISKNTFSIPLQPGDYEWRVNASNAGYNTVYATRSFTVDASSNLGGSEVRLRTPGNDSFTNKTQIEFSWDPVEQADRYLFEIISGLDFDTVMYGTTFKKHLLQEEASYSWRVTALNETGLAVSNTYTFSTDYIPPTAPELLYPRTDTTIFNWPVTLKWRWASDDVISDSLYIYTANRTTLVPNYPKKLTNSPYYSIITGGSLVPGEYYWAVKSSDRAANTGVLSEKRKFIVR